MHEHPIQLDEIQVLANYLSRCPYGEVEPLVTLLKTIAKRPMPQAIAAPTADEVEILDKAPEKKEAEDGNVPL